MWEQEYWRILLKMARELVIPPSHPRYASLIGREKIVTGLKNGVVAAEGLIAHGRGECFDYLIGEQTHEFALHAIDAAACQLLIASFPVLSINGNVAALCSDLIYSLNSLVENSVVEINLFYYTKEREQNIAKELHRHGITRILGTDPNNLIKIPELESNRRFVDCYGIFQADTVFVPLEDGDRTMALKKMNKKVISIDLNPLSRTSKASDITIVDNIVRAIPLLLDRIKFHKMNSNQNELQETIDGFNNERALSQALETMRTGVVLEGT
jgi:4-phosphopantoate--beta-alanine ligase